MIYYTEQISRCDGIGRLACGLGHAPALTVPRTVIHSRRPAAPLGRLNP